MIVVRVAQMHEDGTIFGNRSDRTAVLMRWSFGLSPPPADIAQIIAQQLQFVANCVVQRVCWLCVQKRVGHEHFAFAITEEHQEIRFCPQRETGTMAFEKLIIRSDDLGRERFGSLPQFVVGQIAALQAVSENLRRIGWYQALREQSQLWTFGDEAVARRGHVLNLQSGLLGQV